MVALSSVYKNFIRKKGKFCMRVTIFPQKALDFERETHCLISRSYISVTLVYLGHAVSKMG